MATEAQYRFFKELHDEETRRYAVLDNKAKLYITIITFYLGAIALKSKDVPELTSSLPHAKWLYVGLAAVLAAALLCTVYAMRVRNFEGIADPEEVLRNSGKALPGDADFFNARAVDLAVSTNRNSAQNDRIARTLGLASIFIFLAGIMQLVLVLISVSK